jgi:hypothetical protein
MKLEWKPVWAPSTWQQIPNQYRIPLTGPRVYVSNNNAVAFKSPSRGVEVCQHMPFIRPSNVRK